MACCYQDYHCTTKAMRYVYPSMTFEKSWDCQCAKRIELGGRRPYLLGNKKPAEAGFLIFYNCKVKL
jgi:hypothetical protein